MKKVMEVVVAVVEVFVNGKQVAMELNNEKDNIHSRPFTHIKEIRVHHFFDPLSPYKESRIPLGYGFLLFLARTS
ncbi:hypothetical protein [Bacillus toyonensis]|uniref:hypothetical protein n=1 Tax=Bacillus toyonensis TaxID=155322 RepID=UPI002E24424E|nr:hypothetical protein [Bacillus toyonensis]